MPTTEYWVKYFVVLLYHLLLWIWILIILFYCCLCWYQNISLHDIVDIIFFLYFINIICNNYYENIFFSRQLDFRLSNIIIRYFWTQIFAKPFFFKILFEDMQKCYAILWNQIKKILCSSHCCLTLIAYDIAVKILVIAISWCFF